MGAAGDLALLRASVVRLRGSVRGAWGDGLGRLAAGLLAGAPARFPVDPLLRPGLLRDLHRGLSDLAAVLVSLVSAEALRLQATSLGAFLDEVPAGDADLSPGTLRRDLLLAEGGRILRDLSASSLARFSGRVVPMLESRVASAMWRELSAGSVLSQMSADAAAQIWQLDRVGASVLDFAFNRIRMEALSGRTLLRWTERVDDATGKPADDRVGADSLALHGQVAPAGGSFVMPPDPRVWRGWWGRSWRHPPNRPNCRAVLTPWSAVSGVPAWRWVDGRKLPVVVRPDASA